MFAAPGGTNLRMTLIVGTMSFHAQLGGWGDIGVKTTRWCLVQRNQLGALQRDALGHQVVAVNRHEPYIRCRHNGVVTTLDVAKEEFKARYEERSGWE
jgi:hypothetical protein